MYKFKTLMIAATLGAIVTGICAPQITHANSGGWQKDSVGWWYKDANGSYPRSEWRQINGKWYYFDGNGYIAHSKWAQINGNWYYFNNDGHMTENTWKLIDNQWYYFNTSGHMLSNQWVGDYYVGSNGVMVKNTVTPDNYIVDANGKWNRNFSKDLVEKAKNFKAHIDANSCSKKKCALDFSRFYKVSENTAVQLIEITHPSTNYVSNAQRTAEKTMKRSSTNFSKIRLIDFLVNSEGFTRAEAEKGVSRIKFDYSIAAQRVISGNYLNIKNPGKEGLIQHPYSKEGLIQQLSGNFWRFTKEEARKAVEKYNINYVERAKMAATIQLQYGRYLRADLTKYLVESQKFTNAEATQAVKSLKHANLID